MFINIETERAEELQDWSRAMGTEKGKKKKKEKEQAAGQSNKKKQEEEQTDKETRQGTRRKWDTVKGGQGAGQWDRDNASNRE